MTDTAETIQPADLLRLAFCPQCDYSLRGLPEEGICPECGRKYDQAFIILRGRPSSGHETGGFAPRAILGNSIGIALSLIIFSSITHRNMLHDPVVLLAVAIWVLIAGIALINWFSSVRPGEVLIWLSREGIGQQLPFDPGSPLGSISRWLICPLAMVPMLGTLLSLRLEPMYYYYVPVIIFLLGLVLLTRFAGRPPLASPPEGVRPALYAWRILRDLQLKPHNSNRCSLEAQYGPWIARRYVINIVLEIPEATAAQLRAKITSWGGILVK